MEREKQTSKILSQFFAIIDNYFVTLPLDLLGEALTWARCEAEAADELCVDIATLRTRLAALTRAERAWLRRRLADLSAP